MRLQHILATVVAGAAGCTPGGSVQEADSGPGPGIKDIDFGLGMQLSVIERGDPPGFVIRALNDGKRTGTLVVERIDFIDDDQVRIPLPVVDEEVVISPSVTWDSAPFPIALDRPRRGVVTVEAFSVLDDFPDELNYLGAESATVNAGPSVSAADAAVGVEFVETEAEQAMGLPFVLEARSGLDAHAQCVIKRFDFVPLGDAADAPARVGLGASDFPLHIDETWRAPPVVLPEEISGPGFVDVQIDVEVDGEVVEEITLQSPAFEVEIGGIQ